MAPLTRSQQSKDTQSSFVAGASALLSSERSLRANSSMGSDLEATARRLHAVPTKNSRKSRPSQCPHPHLSPSVKIFRRDVSTLTQAKRAALYTKELQLRDEAITSTYTDPVELELVSPETSRCLQGRYFELDSLQQLLAHADGEVVKDPWNPSQEWPVSQVRQACAQTLASSDASKIRLAVKEYGSRFHIREAWEARR